MARKKSETGKHLFVDSPFYDFSLFESQFKGTDYEYCDLKIYYESVKNWSAGNANKKVDWIATARNFMLSDMKAGKLILKKGVYGTNKAREQQGAELDDLINRKYGPGSVNPGQHSDQNGASQYLF